MTRYANHIGVQVPEVLLPPRSADFSKWAVVACDQFTSQPEYWEEAERLTAGAPTTLHMILPEAYLGKPGEEARIQSAKDCMESYLKQGILQKQPQGFVLVKRTALNKTRNGLVMALDLECYDYNKGSATLIRATEGTIVDRIPPRLRIRSGAKLELPHILVLIDDPDRTVIEPLVEKAEALELLYDTELMQGGGHIEGRLVSGEADINGVLAALTALTDKTAFERQYGAGRAPLLFAMGDGNHSFATAKAAWEQVKATLPESEQAEHPARYALVEIENVHDAGIEFEPIHRVLFGVEPEACVRRLAELLAEQNGGCGLSGCESAEETDALLAEPAEGMHKLPFYYKDACGVLMVDTPAQQLPVGTLQAAIDAYLKENKNAEVDYIHGSDVVLELSQKPGALGFLLPAMEKSELFRTVVYDGALPRKTFSMGEACEKRYYMECRSIVK